MCVLLIQVPQLCRNVTGTALRLAILLSHGQFKAWLRWNIKPHVSSAQGIDKTLLYKASAQLYMHGSPQPAAHSSQLLVKNKKARTKNAAIFFKSLPLRLCLLNSKLWLCAAT